MLLAVPWGELEGGQLSTSGDIFGVSCEPLIGLICETLGSATRLILREICEVRTESSLSRVITGRLLFIVIKSRQAGSTDWPKKSVPMRKAVKRKSCLPFRRVCVCEGTMRMGVGVVKEDGEHGV